MDIISPMTISEQFDALYLAIKRQPPDIRDELLPLFKDLRISHLGLAHKTNKAVKDIYIILQDSHLEIKSLKFDLEITRKERDANS